MVAGHSYSVEGIPCVSFTSRVCFPKNHLSTSVDFELTFLWEAHYKQCVSPTLCHANIFTLYYYFLIFFPDSVLIFL